MRTVLPPAEPEQRFPRTPRSLSDVAAVNGARSGGFVTEVVKQVPVARGSVATAPILADLGSRGGASGSTATARQSAERLPRPGLRTVVAPGSEASNSRRARQGDDLRFLPVVREEPETRRGFSAWRASTSPEPRAVPTRATRRIRILGFAFGILVLVALTLPAVLRAQDTRVADLTIAETAVPIRLMGYGLVVGLDGTGDRAGGSDGGGQTVQSVANLLRRFDVDVPVEVLRTRNVAAVLVTAEVSPYLRRGGRFEVHVSSLGDARSMRGGVLWMTPLLSEVGGDPVASAQGSLMISDGGVSRGSYTVETTARIPGGGLLEGELARAEFASASRLLLRQPDLGTAVRVAEAINQGLGEGMAAVEDPGSVALSLPEDAAERIIMLTQINELRIQPTRVTRIVIDGRDGTVVAGGDLAVGEAVVSHGLVTLSIGGDEGFGGGNAGGPGDVRVPAGTSAQQIASALHAFETPPAEIAAIFESLREIGALAAEVVIR